MGTRINELPLATTPLFGTEILACIQTTAKRFTTDELTAYVLDVVAWATGTTTVPVSGDLFFGYNSGGTKKRFDLDTLVTYVGDALATAAAAAQVSTPVSTDSILIERGDDLEGMAIDTVGTYFLSGAITPSDAIIDTILDLTNLDEDTSIGGAEYMLVGTGATPKWALLSTITAYIHGEIDTYLASLTTITIADADLLYVSDSGTGKKIAASALATYVEGKVSANICEDVWDNATGAVTPATTSVFVLENTGARKTATGQTLYDFVLTTLVADAEAVTPANAHKFLFLSGSDIKTATATALADYIGDYLASGVTAVTPLATDHVMLNDAGVLEKVLVSTLNTKMLDGTTAPSATLKASVLTIDGLDVATLDAINYILIQDGTPKQKALSDVATWIHDDSNYGIAKYIFTKGDADPIVDTDLFLVNRADASLKITAENLADYVETEMWDYIPHTSPVDADELLVKQAGVFNRLTLSKLQTYMTDAIAAAALAASITGWNIVDSGDYIALPAGVNTITMSSTTGITVGSPLRYAYGGTTYYGIVKTVVTDSLITLRGATLVTGGGSNLTELAYGLPSRTRTLRLELPGAYLTSWVVPDNDANADGLNDSEVTETAALAEIARRDVMWREADAYLVAVSVTQGTVDTGAVNQPYVGVRIANVDVLTDNGNDGIQLSGTPGDWTSSGEIAIALAAYDIEELDGIEVKITAQTGLVGDASDVSVELVFVFA